MCIRDRGLVDDAETLVVGPSAAFARYSDDLLTGWGYDRVVHRSVSGLLPAAEGVCEETPHVARLKGESRMSGLPVTSGNKEALPGAMLSEAGHAIRQPAHVAGPSRGPVRTCVGCRHRDDRSVLLRVVAAEVDGVWSVVPDPDHRRIGRGASLHPTPACLDLAERRRAFPRALRRSGPLDTTPVRDHIAAAGGTPSG